MTDETAAPEVGFADLFEQSCKGSLWANKVVKGTITAVDDNFVTVDVGLKSEGRIPMSEFCCGGAKPELKVGDVIVSVMPSALANPLVKTVFPLPKSPFKQITILGNFSLSKFSANSMVSLSSNDVILYSTLITKIILS